MFARRGTGFGRAGSWGWAWRRRKLYCVRERVSWEHKALHFFGGRGRRREAMEMGILTAGTTKVSREGSIMHKSNGLVCKKTKCNQGGFH